MSKRKTTTKPRARRTALGDLTLPAMTGYSPDQSALALKNVPCGACRMDKHEHICPVCNERVAHRPSERATVLNMIVHTLDSIRVRGNVEAEIASGERMAIAMLIGTCTECTRAIQERHDAGKAA